MQADRAEQASALARLDTLVGEWRKEASYSDAPAGRSVIEWALDGQLEYLLHPLPALWCHFDKPQCGRISSPLLDLLVKPSLGHAPFTPYGSR